MNIRPSLKLAIAIFVGYVIAWIGVARVAGGSDLQYGEAFKNLDDTRPLVYGLIGGAVFGVVVASVLGWWKDILREERRASGWFKFIPLILLVAVLITTDWGNYGNIEGSLLAWTVAAAVLVGFSEELTFRGLEVVNLRKASMSEARVCAISSVLFGLIHVPNFILGADVGPSIVQALLATATGSLFYVVRRTTGTILVPMALHGVWDFTLFSSGEDFNLSGLRIVISLVVFIAFIATHRRFFDAEQPAEHAVAA